MMDLMLGRRLVVVVHLLPLQHSQQALVDTDILLLRLHHPHALLSHVVHNAEDVHVLGAPRDLLDDAVQCDEGARAAHARAAVHHDGPLVGPHALAEGAHKAHQRLRGVRDAKVRPRREVEVSYGTLSFSLKSQTLIHQFRPVTTRHAANEIDKCE